MTPRDTVATKSLLAGVGPGFGQIRPLDPDVLRPQTRGATSQGFELTNKLVFNPLAKPSEGDRPIQLTLSKSFPWPVFLPEPLTLEVEAPVGGKFELNGTLKREFKLFESDRVELTPYFFVGGGVDQDNFKDINAGGGASMKLKLFKDIGVPGASLGLEADGGLKYKHDLKKNEGEVEGYFESNVVFTVPFIFF